MPAALQDAHKSGKPEAESPPPVIIRVPDVGDSDESQWTEKKRTSWRAPAVKARFSLVGLAVVLVVLMVAVIRTPGLKERHPSQTPIVERNGSPNSTEDKAPLWSGTSRIASRTSSDYPAEVSDSQRSAKTDPIEIEARPTHTSPAAAIQHPSEETPVPAGILLDISRDSQRDFTSQRELKSELSKDASGVKLVNTKTEAIGDGEYAKWISAVELALAERLAAEREFAEATREFDRSSESRRVALLEAERRLSEASEQQNYLENKLQHANLMVRKGHLAPARRDSLVYPLERAVLECENLRITRDRISNSLANSEMQDAARRRDAAAARMETARAEHQLALAELERHSSQISLASADAHQSAQRQAPPARPPFSESARNLGQDYPSAMSAPTRSEGTARSADGFAQQDSSLPKIN